MVTTGVDLCVPRLTTTLVGRATYRTEQTGTMTGDGFVIRHNEAGRRRQLFVSLQTIITYRVFRWECARLRYNVPYVKVHRYNPKHLYPKLNGYGDNGERSLKV